MPSFEAVEERLRHVAGRLSTEITVAGENDGYPLYAMTFGRGYPLWLSAGIHGEEPGSVEGMLWWLEQHAVAWQDTYRFTVMPCLNPWGYERGVRETADGMDPNRQFRTQNALVQAVQATLKEGSLALDLHEDIDFHGFYMFEISDRAYYGRRIVDAIREVGPISDGTDWPEPEIEDGLAIRRAEADQSFQQRMMEWEQWPIAFFLYRVTGHVMTFETPGRQDIMLRAAMHAKAVETALSLEVQRLKGT